jgi:hypothetical protein
LEGGQRIHVAGREPAEAAVSKTRLFLLFEQSLEVIAEFGNSLPHLICYAEVKQIKCDMRAWKIFRGEVGDSTGLLFAVAFDCVYTVAKHTVTDC